MPYYISPPPQNPFSRIITGIIAVLALAGAFMLGLVALLVFLGAGLIAGCAIWLRVTWIKRRLRKSGLGPGANTSQPETELKRESGEVIEAEYTVISKREE